jgi:uncharacterized protein
MDDNDRAAIDGLFRRLADTGRTAAPRDPEAEALIARQVALTPGAAYFMAQTLLVQEAALARCQDRLAELEARCAEMPRAGGFLASLFAGDDSAPSRRLPPGLPQGPGFLGSAAQTAMGVAGGVLIANAIAGLWADDAAGPFPGFGGEDWDPDLSDDFDI